MDSHYANRTACLLHFSGHYYERGSGFVALAARIGRKVLSLSRPFVFLTAKHIGKELLNQSVREVLDVVVSTKYPKHALKKSQNF